MKSEFDHYTEEKKTNKVYIDQSQNLLQQSKITITEDYIGVSGIRPPPRRSISQSRIEFDGEEFEEITDESYTFTEDEWLTILKNGW